MLVCTQCSGQNCIPTSLMNIMPRHLEVAGRQQGLLTGVQTRIGSKALKLSEIRGGLFSTCRSPRPGKVFRT